MRSTYGEVKAQATDCSKRSFSGFFCGDIPNGVISATHSLLKPSACKRQPISLLKGRMALKQKDRNGITLELYGGPELDK